MMRFLSFLLCSAVLLAPTQTFAARVTVPINIGVAPSANFFTGPVGADTPVHFGIELRLHAIIDKQTIQANKKKIPKRYRKMASKVDEIRISPSIFIPESILLSPPLFSGTGMYGATWKFINIGIPLVNVGSVKLRLSAGAILSMFFLHSNSLLDSAGNGVKGLLFIRPGIDPSIELEIKITRSFLVSLGWQSNLYLPQVIDADFATSFRSVAGDGAALNRSIWHVGQAWLMLHFRFPRTMNI